MEKAEECLKKGLESSSPQFLGKGYLLLSILQFHNGKIDNAISSFHTALKVDKLFCKRTVERHLGSEVAEAVLEAEKKLERPTKKELKIVAKDEVLSALQELIIPRAPSKYPQVAQQLNEFDYLSGYVAALEKFGDGDIEEALRIIEGLIKGNREVGALFWAKAACLLSKREWEGSLVTIVDQLSDPTIPEGVLWNAACAYFNLGKYENALMTIIKCTQGGYRTSPGAWLIQGLLAHLCGEGGLRNHAIKEAIRISPKQLAFYVMPLKQIGADLKGLPSEEEPKILRVGEEQQLKKYEEIVRNAQTLLKTGKDLEAAREFGQLSPESIVDIPEIGETTFKPVILPTCPAELYDYRDVFLFGVAAFQRKAYEEAVKNFEDIYVKTDRSYPSAVNLAASLISIERYSRAIDVLRDAIESREQGGAYAIRNRISALVRSGKPEEAFQWFDMLLDASSTEYFNFVQMAYVADLLERKEDVATALFNACTMNLTEPSFRLKGAAIEACLEVKDDERATALVKFFVEETPLPYVVAGVTRPLMPANDCKKYWEMKAQYENFTKARDARAALAYFQEVHSAREADYSASINVLTVDALFNACMFYARSLFLNDEFDQAHEILGQGFSILTDHANCYLRRTLSERYFVLTYVYFQRSHYFWAKELCERGLEAERNNKRLLELLNRIERRIEKIPERSREAMKELAELPLSTTEKTTNLVGLLPKVSQLIQTLPADFPASREVIADLEDVTNGVISLESVPIVGRKKEIVRQREVSAKIERYLPLYLPKTFISALLPVLKGIRRILDEVQIKSVCPEFTLGFEAVNYYRENEASLVFKLRNIGAAAIRKVQIKVESDTPQVWAPILEEQSLELIQKDELLWIDWPIHFDTSPEPESMIKPKISIRFTGGSLKGAIVEQVIDVQESKLMPFIDISVDYPVIALQPGENNKLYGRENLLRTLKNSFNRSGQTRIPFLEGVRKVGKTSILYFLKNRLADSFLPVYVNLDTSWTNPYQLLAKEVSKTFTVKRGLEFGDLGQIETKEGFDRFLANSIRKTDITHIVLLFDEFHTVIDRIEKGTLQNEFLGDLRYMYMDPQQQISVAFADWYLIDELKSRVPAQLWTDFAREPISFLNELDTREAILFPAQESPLRFERDVISRIYYWTNGYPWHIQWICSELINHLNTQKRYVAIPQDIDLIVQKLLRDDRLFNEGLCRPERLSTKSQDVIYGIFEEIKNLNGDICTWFNSEVIAKMRLPFDVKHEIAKLTQLEVFQERDNQLRFCSPLHAMWFEAKQKKGADIHGDLSKDHVERDQNISPIEIPEDPASEINKKCDRIKNLKSQLRQALFEEHQIFKNVEMPEEWTNACTVVKTRDSWEVFIKAFRDLFVEDMRSRLDSWDDRKIYLDLNKELHSIRKRRNYAEHPDSVDGREEEEKCCLEDLGKRVPTKPDDWLGLQLRALDRVIGVLEKTVEQISRAGYERNS
jgi:tetratricopeptide (TPR) repeat protein